MMRFQIKIPWSQVPEESNIQKRKLIVAQLIVLKVVLLFNHFVFQTIIFQHEQNESLI